MEEYAVNRLTQIFYNYNQGDLQSNRRMAVLIINALICKHNDMQSFKLAFWKILWNLHLKNKRSVNKTLHNLFGGKWPTVEDFINATDNELDEDCEVFRNEIKTREFKRIENTMKINKLLDGECSNDSGLICNKCHSNNTDYTMLQTRRGDEGSTIYSFCKECGHRWKFN
jgi:DNA-directed RNA polymerase subunit M/transcription elongation factor TFIIS